MENYTKNKYYIRLNENNRIIKTFSSIFEAPEDSDILVGEGEGAQFRVGSNILEESLQEYIEVENGLRLINEFGVYMLKYENGVICKLTEEELEASKPVIEIKPTEVELLKEENLKIILATTTLFEQVLKLEEDNVDLRTAIVELYVKLVLAGRKTIEEVPENLREDVRNKLN